ncbi:hypothetical protein A6P39_044205 (plasmid) [Streptomyces sp. FXJ1.172]|uniref:hypothetical protein n=1 Tax=Streptomyces sp. FXJ1.172 TaxID=710705 RepID=UPI0023DD3E4D|nr:hypothetical protein [Streptomyces sp. FXJ1.172]WEP00716.1 hypothetical protein A6P39_044205 [Streptomyces sp. FXJ1.172]
MSDAVAVQLRPERFRHAASFRIKATTGVLIGSNASGMAAMLDALALACGVVRVEQYVQSGKTTSAGSVLRTVLAADDHRQVLHQAQEQQDSIEFARSLLRSAEEATQLPSITTQAVGSTPIRAAADLPPFDDLDRGAKAAEQFWLLALDLLHAQLGLVHGGFLSPAPTCQSSPCGVIRLAAPRVPRAPGGPATLPFSSNSCVLAA